jgi:glycosyltransferase involved in cell wall biosynthesis
MASGLPVVATRCGGPETSVVDGETGYLVPIGDAQELACAMAKLLRSSSLRDCMGKRARRRATEHFSVTTAGQKILDKYDEMLAR